MLNRIKAAYRKAPNFEIVYSLIERCILIDENNLFRFILNSLNMVKEYLQIRRLLLCRRPFDQHV